MSPNLEFTADDFSLFEQLIMFKYKLDLPTKKEWNKSDEDYITTIRKALNRPKGAGIKDQFYSKKYIPGISKKDFKKLCNHFEILFLRQDIKHKYPEASSINENFKKWKEIISNRFDNDDYQVNAKNWPNKISRLKLKTRDHSTASSSLNLNEVTTPNLQLDLVKTMHWNLHFEKDDKGKITFKPTPDFPIQDEGTLIEELNLAKAMTTMLEFYGKFREKYPYESNYFLALKRLFEKRRLMLSERASLYVSQKKEMKKLFENQMLELYELQDNKIIKRTFSFANNPISIDMIIENKRSTKVKQENFINTDYGFICDFLHPLADNEKIHRGTCEVDILQGYITMKHNSDLKSNINESVDLFFNTGLKYWTGYRIKYDKSKATINSWYVVMQKSPLQKDPKKLPISYIALDKYHKSIPEFIRSILLAPMDHNIHPHPFLNLPLAILSDVDIYRELILRDR